MGAVTARATIVMTARERHGLTVRSIESIVRNTAPPYRFLFAGGPIPEWLKRVFADRAAEWHLEWHEFGDSLWPNQIRRRIVPNIDTDYVVFLDNDVFVSPGWLEKLVAAADGTGAAIVCPLYLIGSGETATRIHMAGGSLTWTTGLQGNTLQDEHRLANRDVSSLAPAFGREECDFAEYHCVLVRTAAAKSDSLFDERIVCVHEHIDTALSVKKAGYKIFLEPAARVAYAATAPFALADLAFFRSRWASAAAESSIAAFCAKWNVTDNEKSFGAVRRFLDIHRQRTDPLRLSRDEAAARRPMQAHDVKQTLSGLFELARTHGYRREELQSLKDAYWRAVTLMDGRYRPCGRPFINHLAGTASVLVHYDFKLWIVLAGLLHSAYSQRTYARDRQNLLAEISKMLGGKDSPVERRVRVYTDRAATWESFLLSPDPLSEMLVADAEILAIAAAGEVDMLLSGEIRFAGREDMVSQDIADLMTRVCESIGVPGLAETMNSEREKLLRGAPAPETPYRQSFSLGRNGAGRTAPAARVQAQRVRERP